MISLNCPAKINLGLRVTGLRDDGYHQLSGHMVCVPWFDRLDVALVDLENQCGDVVLEVIRDDCLSVSDAPEGDANIVSRAARLCLNRLGIADRFGVSLTLHKSIPAGTGLGGASSDAAGVLLALNQLAAGLGICPLDSEQLRQVAAELGSDSVFFLDPTLSRIVGRGEAFEGVGADFCAPVVIAVPSQRLSTKAVFAAWDARHNHDANGPKRLTGKAGSDIRPSLSVYPSHSDGWCMSPELFENDLSDVVFDLCPRSAALAGMLRNSGARVVVVTGSGSAVYGLYDDIGSAYQSAHDLSLVIQPGEIVRAFQTGKVF
jgi:4-diphosphocytidyl-2-C-methyl-D-erythritol kinase